MNIEDVLRSHGIGVGSGSGSGDMLLNSYRRTETLAADANSVTIGIPQFNSSRDILIVHQNTTFIDQDVHYTLSSDGLSINKAVGVWDTGTKIHFLVFTSTPSTDALNSVCLTNSITIPVNGTTEIEHGISVFSKTTDTLQVFEENLMWYPNDQYTLSEDGRKIIFNGFTMSAGSKLFVLCWKKVRDNIVYTDASNIPADSIKNFQLHPENKVGLLVDLDTGITQRETTVSAINQLKNNLDLLTLWGGW